MTKSDARVLTMNGLSMNSVFLKRAMRHGGTALAVCALSVGMACASSLDTLETFLKSTKSGRADFTQVVTPPAKAGQTTVRSKTSTGQFSFVRPTRFRFDYTKPLKWC